MAEAPLPTVDGYQSHRDYTREQDTLAFTGLDMGLLVITAFALVLFGALLRKLSRVV